MKPKNALRISLVCYVVLAAIQIFLHPGLLMSAFDRVLAIQYLPAWSYQFLAVLLAVGSIVFGFFYRRRNLLLVVAVTFTNHLLLLSPLFKNIFGSAYPVLPLLFPLIGSITVLWFTETKR